MKTYKLTYLAIVAFLCNGGFIWGQVSNIGTLSVASDTQVAVVNPFDNHPSGTLINDGALLVYDDFNNDGTVDYTNGNASTTFFIGNGIQKITGGQISYFYNVVFDNVVNVAPFELSADISIANEAEFAQGIINNQDFGGQVQFETNAMHFNTSDDSYVNGAVVKHGNTAFDFPIGDGQFYRYTAISAPNDSNASFISNYYLENPDALYPLESHTGIIALVNNTEYWQVAPMTGGQNEVMLTLSWHEQTTMPELLEDIESTLHIVRWDAAQQLWVDEGGIINIDNQTISTPMALDAYGIFTLAKVKNELILPGDITIYNAVSPNSNGENDYFLIDNIEHLPNNKVEIFNRWGVKVFETTAYDTAGNVFRGESDGRLTSNGSQNLPAGTYFYVLSYDYDNGMSTQRVKQSGYLYLNTD